MVFTVSGGRAQADVPVGSGLADRAVWHDAQAALASALAAASQAFGALDERLRWDGPRRQLHLALMEATALSWHVGDRASLERVTLSHADGAAPPNAVVERAVRSVNWLLCQNRNDPDETRAPSLRSDTCRPRDLHPLVEGARYYALYQARHLLRGACADGTLASVAEQESLTQAALRSARIGASAGRGGARFLPLALGGGQALRRFDDAQTALAQWINAVEAGAFVALSQLERLSDWQARAEAAIGVFSGRTASKLISVLAARPVCSAPLAETESGASRAAVQRNLDRLAALGLIREVTGQGRYRLWAPAF